MRAGVPGLEFGILGLGVWGLRFGGSFEVHHTMDIQQEQRSSRFRITA